MRPSTCGSGISWTSSKGRPSDALGWPWGNTRGLRVSARQSITTFFIVAPISSMAWDSGPFELLASAHEEDGAPPEGKFRRLFNCPQYTLRAARYKHGPRRFASRD